MYSPFLLVVTLKRRAPLSLVSRMTVAPSTIWLAESTTLPLTMPVDWANPGVGPRHQDDQQPEQAPLRLPPLHHDCLRIVGSAPRARTGSIHPLF